MTSSFEQQELLSNANNNTAQCYQNKDEILSVVTSEAFLIHFLLFSTHLVCSHTSTLQPDPFPSITTTSCSLDLKCKNQDYLPRASKREEGKDNSRTVFLGLFVFPPLEYIQCPFKGCIQSLSVPLEKPPPAWPLCKAPATHQGTLQM